MPYGLQAGPKLDGDSANGAAGTNMKGKYPLSCLSLMCHAQSPALDCPSDCEVNSIAAADSQH